MFSVELRNIQGQPTAIAHAGPHTVIVDRPVEAGGGGLGFNGGQLLYLAVAGCISNDLFREAQARGLRIESVRVVVDGDFGGDPAVSGPISYAVEISGDGDAVELERLVQHVDRIAEIPNSLRHGTAVQLAEVRVSAR